jgi:hypothetical protein
MVGVGAPCPTMGSSPEGNEKGDRGEEVGARCWGAREAGGGLQEGVPWGLGLLMVVSSCSVRAERE